MWCDRAPQQPDLHATYISGPTLGDDHPPQLQYERDPPFWTAQ